MTVEFDRFTVSKSVTVSGLGLHSGEPVAVTVSPGDEGIWFSLFGERVQARPEHVSDTSRCTKLGSISTIEHVMSALAGLGVSDAEIEVSAPELPALDGGAGIYVEALQSAGRTCVGGGKFSLFERVFFIEDPIRIAIAKGTGHWRFDFESGDRWPGVQSFECQLNPEVFAQDIAGARTFAFEEEVAPLRAAGLAKGLDETSALVLGQSGYVNEAKWTDEPARHKLLDLIGDLALAGVPVHLVDVVAVRSGHRTNVEAAKRLAQHARIETAP